MEQLRSRAIDLPPAPAQTKTLTIKVTLEETDPAVWRRLEVAGDMTLDRLHEVLQTAMGWTDSHLHRFFVGPAPTGPHFLTDFDLEEGEDGTPETEAQLDQVLREPGDRLRYEYDFGDGWEHELLLEGFGPISDDPRPRCSGGELACPPEDVGGPGGYADVAAWVRAGRPEEAVPHQFESLDDALTCLPADWDPDAFDVDAADLRLQALSGSGQILDSLREEALEAVMRLSMAQSTVSTWLALSLRTTLQPADLDAVTEPYRQLLAITGGGVELTASGYLRPPVVQELCTAFDLDPILAGKATRENNIFPLALFRKGAQQVGLLHVSRKVLMPTAAGIRFGDDPSGLWRHVASRLPVGRDDLRTDVGWYTLLALAGGVGDRDIFGIVHELCVDAGWEQEEGSPIDHYAVNQLVRPTLSAVVGPRWSSRGSWPSWVPAAAASVLFQDQLV